MIKKLFFIVIVSLVIIGLGVWLLVLRSRTTNPEGYATIGDIPTPSGYERMKGSDTAYASFLRSLPLKPKGSKVKLYTGGTANSQNLAYAVVDLPLLNNWEQCADVCIRMRAEYLFNTKQYSRIHFQDVNGKTMSYDGGSSRKGFESYLKKVYGTANTFSLKHELPRRKLGDMQPGDVFVYAAGDHNLDRMMKSKYGHAIMVVDVAVDSKGNKKYMLAEGNTPARDIHILRNWKSIISSPWFDLDPDAETLFIDCFYYKSNELRHFE